MSDKAEEFYKATAMTQKHGSIFKSLNGITAFAQAYADQEKAELQKLLSISEDSVKQCVEENKQIQTKYTQLVEALEGLFDNLPHGCEQGEGGSRYIYSEDLENILTDQKQDQPIECDCEGGVVWNDEIWMYEPCPKCTNKH